MTDTMSAVADETDENEMPDQPKKPSRLEERRAIRAASPARKAVSELAESGALDGLFAKIDTGQVDLPAMAGSSPSSSR